MGNKDRLISFIINNLRNLDENKLQKIADMIEEYTYDEDYRDYID